MTHAVCLKCGCVKRGALTPCPECGFDPSDDQMAVAKSLVLSDHHQSLEALKKASETIKAGGKVDFNDDELDAMADHLSAASIPKMPVGCTIAVWTPAVIMVLLALAVVYIYLVLLK
jgi:hypothetical protein